ncbi:unnamed protein product [Peronospora destructor]|uniref:Extradiol ring-cleavage dioxygenase class III enzyme subunit B domain-containing protein n=1 Tax=Peronospora destructor TaxID=86335 RepID=A0AAV0U7S5_9STRA|nr:unnamed protein product [Peronospora destructor]
MNLPKRILYASNAVKPDMIGDYHDFSSKAYDVVYPAKGNPTFAQEMNVELEKNNIKATLVDRGFDLGVFLPMLLIRPEADIPIVAMFDQFTPKQQGALRSGSGNCIFP